MKSEVLRLSTYVFAGTVSTEDEAFELEKNLYCFHIPIRTEVDETTGEVRIYTFQKYKSLVSGVIDHFKRDNYVLESKALEQMMYDKVGFSHERTSQQSRRRKRKNGVSIRLFMVVVIIFALMVLFKQL